MHSWINCACVWSCPPAPRRSRADDATAREGEQQLSAGCIADGTGKSFKILKQAGIQECQHQARASLLLWPKGTLITLRTLWRRLNAVNPTLTRQNFTLHMEAFTCMSPSVQELYL